MLSYKVSIIAIILYLPSLILGQMTASITEDINTDFGIYHPNTTVFTPAVPDYTIQPDFSNIVNLYSIPLQLSSGDSTLLLRNHFIVKYSKYKQLYDIYNENTWTGMPIFVTTDAVLHIYHVLFDQLLIDLETRLFIPALNRLTETMLDSTEAAYYNASKPEAKEALRRNLAFFSVAKKLLQGQQSDVPSITATLVDSELVYIADHDGFHISPIFGNFSALDYSQFQPRGHYTINDSLKSYFKTMIWYSWTIFTMESALFNELAEQHSLQSILLIQMLSIGESEGQPIRELWETIYEPTVFYVGKTDDPAIADYKSIADFIYGPNFLTLTPDSLANGSLLADFMTQAQTLPEPKIPNWIYGTFIKYKGFRFMGQRFIPDSYLFANLVLPKIPGRHFPKGLDVMTVLGSERAYTLLDSIYNETAFTGYTDAIQAFKNDFVSMPAEEWVQNLYWNWLYCLMPLLYEKSTGYPAFMQTLAWADKELMTALASWAELRHDTILYAKQSMSPCGVPPGPPRSYVEPNPHLYSRLASLVHFTHQGLESFTELSGVFKEKLDLFETLLLFLKEISIKELENQAITDNEYENIYCFGKVMKQLVSKQTDPQNSFNCDTDDMAVVADVHTDSNTDQCLEEGVGYPLEIYVIVNQNGQLHLTRGAMFSYYEFLQPISNRLTDESWRELLTGDSPPAMPEWSNNFMDTDNPKPTLFDNSPENLYTGEFTPVIIKTIDIPIERFLYQNYPNPFNPITTIQFDLPVKSHINLTIYNVLGQKIKTLINGQKNEGVHTVQWDSKDGLGNHVANGIYLYQLRTNDFIQTKRMFLLR